jgi:serralysin
MANNQAGFDGDWEAGSYTWQVLLHETAHALGLKHPGNYNAGGGGTRGPYLSKATDTRGNTLMSYHNAAEHDAHQL